MILFATTNILHLMRQTRCSGSHDFLRTKSLTCRRDCGSVQLDGALVHAKGSGPFETPRWRSSSPRVQPSLTRITFNCRRDVRRWLSRPAGAYTFLKDTGRLFLCAARSTTGNFSSRNAPLADNSSLPTLDIAATRCRGERTTTQIDKAMRWVLFEN